MVDDDEEQLPLQFINFPKSLILNDNMEVMAGNPQKK